ncbi:MAG: hypothetical protein ACYCZB_04055 [Acidiphilium sp.]
MIAVRMAKGPTIRLGSGAEFDFLDPWNSEFTLDDVANALGKICRYSGQCSDFYSVAEHSLLVSQEAVGFELEALMHDAAEAFLGDVTRPLKQLLPQYKEIERNVESAIYSRFNIDRVGTAVIKAADLRVLAAEQRQVMPPGTDAWAGTAGVEPARVSVKFLSPDVATSAFLARYRQFT